jgi:hypothetical protein
VCDDEDICTIDTCDPTMGCEYEQELICPIPTPVPAMADEGRGVLLVLMLPAGAAVLMPRRRRGV